MLKILNKTQAEQIGARYSATAPLVRRQKEEPKPPDYGADIQRVLFAIESLCTELCQTQAAQGAGLLQAFERSSATGTAAAQSSTQALVRLLRNILDQQRQTNIEFSAAKPNSPKAVRFTVLRRDDKNRAVEFVAEEVEASSKADMEIIVASSH